MKRGKKQLLIPLFLLALLAINIFLVAAQTTALDSQAGSFVREVFLPSDTDLTNLTYSAGIFNVSTNAFLVITVIVSLILLVVFYHSVKLIGIF